MTNGQGIDRTFEIIECISQEDGLTLAQITKKVNLSKSTVFRTLNELSSRSYVSKDENSKYHLGYKFVQIASLYLSRLDVKSVASPIMHELSRDMKCACHLAVLSDDKCVYIEKVNPFIAGINYSEIGKTNELYCSALGKMLLSGFNDKDLKKYINSHEFVKFTNTTLTKDDLVEEIKKIRETKISYDDQEREEGVYCISAPIYDYKNEMVAALSISSTTKEVLTNEIYFKKIKEYSYSISLIFGWRGNI